MWNMLTLDGLVRWTGDRAVHRLPQIWDEDLQRLALTQSKSADALLFGRVTYEMMAGYWASATGEVAEFMNATPKVVFSRSLRQAGWKNSRLVTERPESEVASMKRRPGKELWILGSSALSDLLLQHGLIDEWRLAVSPIVLGSCNPPREPETKRSKMRLLETRRLTSGGLVLRYARMARSSRLPDAASLRTAVRRRPTSTTVVDGPFAETKEWALAYDGSGRSE